jgi:hypothetical protein
MGSSEDAETSRRDTADLERLTAPTPIMDAAYAEVVRHFTWLAVSWDDRSIDDKWEDVSPSESIRPLMEAPSWIPSGGQISDGHAHGREADAGRVVRPGRRARDIRGVGAAVLCEAWAPSCQPEVVAVAPPQ